VFDIARRITIVSRDPATRPLVIHEKVRRRRKRSPALKPFEQLERRLLRANEDFASDLLRQHNRSNLRRRDGWLYDAPANLLRAESKFFRRLFR
jgi:hypothetical protein